MGVHDSYKDIFTSWAVTSKYLGLKTMVETSHEVSFAIHYWGKWTCLKNARQLKESTQ